MKQDSQKPRYSTLHYGVREQLELNWAEYVLLDLVYHLSAKFGYCNMGRGILAANLGVTRMGLHKMISRLIERELLVASLNGLTCGTAFIDIAYLEKDVNKVYKRPSARKQSLQVERKLSLPSVNKVAPASTEFTNNRGDNNNINTLELQSIGKPIAAEPPTVHGKPDINQLFDYWTTKIGYPISSQLKANRYAASNLIKKHGTANVLKLIDGVAQAQADEYAPRIANFSQLQSKLDQLILWGRQQNKQSKEVFRI